MIIYNSDLSIEITIKIYKTKSQNFLDPGFAKPKSLLNLGFKNTDLG